MKLTWKKSSRGLTLVEVMVTVLLISVAVIGAMGFRYFCALDARKADVQITGARLGWMLLEDWKAAGGDATYRPEMKQTQLPPGPGPAKPDDFDYMLGSYHIDLKDVDGLHYYATLSYRPAYQDTQGAHARALNVNVAWMGRGQEWDGSGPYKTLGLTTYMN
jgi:prepilin-type N-terminal cleavage/methylation domain-containing protein